MSFPPADNVIRSGFKAKAGPDLLVQDLFEQPAACGKVRVGKILMTLGQFRSNAVSPVAQPTRALLLRIPHPFLNDISQSDIPAPGVPAILIQLTVIGQDGDANTTARHAGPHRAHCSTSFCGKASLDVDTF
jgi:hypothetical protein